GRSSAYRRVVHEARRVASQAHDRNRRGYRENAGYGAAGRIGAVRQRTPAGLGCLNLFVYGTLRRRANNKHSRLLSANARFLGNARMPGRLCRMGKYAAAVPSDKPGEWVQGEVFHLAEPSRILRVLDEYEGPEWKRSITRVRLDRGRWLEAWVYVPR